MSLLRCFALMLPDNQNRAVVVTNFSRPVHMKIIGCDCCSVPWIYRREVDGRSEKSINCTKFARNDCNTHDGTRGGLEATSALLDEVCTLVSDYLCWNRKCSENYWRHKEDGCAVAARPPEHTHSHFISPTVTTL